ncbi:hypothetical protein GCM10009687_19850 [Asanoa iriomotensis]|uniref:Uncharacterized protein n=1 Tax=Asanoa iriomotensis TaxID=234613 RepID=A0ABQ4C242_9ACTN|nr:hypothetical protein Air01nite_29430 [Asanoa iriomotensis]
MAADLGGGPLSRAVIPDHDHVWLIGKLGAASVIVCTRSGRHAVREHDQPHMITARASKRPDRPHTITHGLLGVQVGRIRSTCHSSYAGANTPTGSPRPGNMVAQTTRANGHRAANETKASTANGAEQRRPASHA